MLRPTVKDYQATEKRQYKSENTKLFFVLSLSDSSHRSILLYFQGCCKRGQNQQCGHCCQYCQHIFQMGLLVIAAEDALDLKGETGTVYIHQT